MNIYDPNNSDVIEWISSGSSIHQWPESDWDYYVCNGKNDLLILQMAEDAECQHRAFFVHCLYHLVGDYYLWNPSNNELRQRIEDLITKADEGSSEEVRAWAREAKELFSSNQKFIKNYWIGHLFFDGDLPE